MMLLGWLEQRSHVIPLLFCEEIGSMDFQLNFGLLNTGLVYLIYFLLIVVDCKLRIRTISSHTLKGTCQLGIN